jgi:hypothetical protein
MRVAIVYHWNGVFSEVFDIVEETAKREGHHIIETIEKLFITKDEYRVMAMFYYVRIA